MLNVLTVEDNQGDELWSLAWRLVGSLWGKSAARAGGRTHLLLGHLLDTAAVAELIWDHYLSLGFKRRWDLMGNGNGRRLFAWLCAVHDLGKATPGFQCCDSVEQQRPKDAELAWRESRFGRKRWRHDQLGAAVLQCLLEPVWDRKQVDWVWPLVAGHHGLFPAKSHLPFKHLGAEQVGTGDRWRLAQRALLESVTASLGFVSLAEVEPAVRPSRADQLALAGFVVMADWIASDTTYFKGLDALEDISMQSARERAAAAWSGLRLRRGWGSLPVPDRTADLVLQRFGTPARGCQPMVVDLIHQLPAPGLVLVEAPMGEGKTRTALAGAEVFAARFGCDGALVAMPTQATCTPMYTQILEWVGGFDAGLRDQVQLLHGKRQFNQEWRSIWQERRGRADEDDFGSVGEDDCYGMGAHRVPGDSGPPVWFLGAKRGLLTAFGIATIDQLLFAATRTKHVMLRFAGLAGKVVVIDEVHAADIYMSQFLFECLRLLGQAGVPVILLSATLPPAQRRALCEAYAEGASGRRVDLHLPDEASYPRVTAVWEAEGIAHVRAESARPWRSDLAVQLEILDESGSAGTAVAARLRTELCDGGTALVVVNSVGRAQEIYEQLKRDFDEAVLLLHGRLADADRAERTDQCLAVAGPGPSRDPAQRRVIVATQVAEQSFDIDADLLITDIAPIDLLLQRIGRLHRALDTPRPGPLQAPKVLITGLRWTEAAPVFNGACEAVYGRHLLLRSASLIHSALADGAGSSWAIPSQVPALVEEGYRDWPELPSTWETEVAKAQTEWDAREQHRAATAQDFVLTPETDRFNPTLAGLHRRAFETNTGAGHASDEHIRALVRDGQRSAEVVLISTIGGRYTAIDGTRLGPNGEVPDDALASVLGGTVRLPGKYTEAAEQELRPLPGWEGHPWLGYALALELDTNGEAVLKGRRLRYDAEFGLRER